MVCVTNEVIVLLAVAAVVFPLPWRNRKLGVVLALGVSLGLVIWAGVARLPDGAAGLIGTDAILGLAAGLLPLVVLVPWVVGHRPAKAVARLAVPVDDVLPAAWAADARGPSDPLNAVLMRLSLLGVVQLQTAGTGPSGDRPRLRVTRTDVPVPSGMTGASYVLAELGLQGPGAWCVLEADSVGDGEAVASIDDGLSRMAREAAADRGWIRLSAAGVLGSAVTLALPAAAIAVVALTQDAPLALGLGLAGLIGLFVDPSMLYSWSPEGQRVREQTRSLREALRTDAVLTGLPEGARFGTFETLLPWAAAFGLVGLWTLNCRVPLNSRDPVEVWATAASTATAVAHDAMAAATKAKRERWATWAWGGDGGGGDGGGGDGGGDGGGVWGWGFGDGGGWDFGGDGGGDGGGGGD